MCGNLRVGFRIRCVITGAWLARIIFLLTQLSFSHAQPPQLTSLRTEYVGFKGNIDYPTPISDRTTETPANLFLCDGPILDCFVNNTKQRETTWSKWVTTVYVLRYHGWCTQEWTSHLISTNNDLYGVRSTWDVSLLFIMPDCICLCPSDFILLYMLCLYIYPLPRGVHKLSTWSIFLPLRLVKFWSTIDSMIRNHLRRNCRFKPLHPNILEPPQNQSKETSGEVSRDMRQKKEKRKRVRTRIYYLPVWSPVRDTLYGNSYPPPPVRLFQRKLNQNDM